MIIHCHHAVTSCLDSGTNGFYDIDCLVATIQTNFIDRNFCGESSKLKKSMLLLRFLITVWLATQFLKTVLLLLKALCLMGSVILVLLFRNRFWSFSVWSSDVVYNFLSKINRQCRFWWIFETNFIVPSDIFERDSISARNDRCLLHNDYLIESVLYFLDKSLDAELASFRDIISNKVLKFLLSNFPHLVTLHLLYIIMILLICIQ